MAYRSWWTGLFTGILALALHGPAAQAADGIYNLKNTNTSATASWDLMIESGNAVPYSGKLVITQKDPKTGAWSTVKDTSPSGLWDTSAKACTVAPAGTYKMTCSPAGGKFYLKLSLQDVNKNKRVFELKTDSKGKFALPEHDAYVANPAKPMEMPKFLGAGKNDNGGFLDLVTDFSRVDGFTIQVVEPFYPL